MSTQSTSVIVFGAAGRMGSRLCALASSDPAFELRAAVARAGPRRDGETIAGTAIAPIDAKTAAKQAISADAVIDFSSDEGALGAVALARAARAALVVGTTALGAAALGAVEELSRERPVLVAPNTSLGVAALATVAARLGAILGPAYECSIVEAHHNRKRDAPSGTALRLADAVRAAGHEVRDDQVVSIRGGDVIGEHTIRFAGPGEYLELVHRATSRDLFAIGALRAAAWLKGRAPGRYTIEDVVGIGAR